MAEIRINTKSSLTVCEGISAKPEDLMQVGDFPHCV